MSDTTPSTADRLRSVDAWWRAANYLTVGQIYLMDDPLLNRPLAREDIKPRLLGHWGTSPALNLVYAHCSAAIRDSGRPMLYVCGPGHGGPAMNANAWLDGTWAEHLFPPHGDIPDVVWEPVNARLRNVIEFIHANAHRPLTLADLAASVDYSPRGLQERFRVAIGIAPMEYLRRVRLEQARADLLLADGRTTTVGTIARRWGFAHMGRFAMQYAALHGESPSDTLRR